MGEQRSGRIAAEALELVAGVHRVGDDHAVGGLDGAPGLAEVLHRLASVETVVVEALGAQHLEVAQLHEQQDEDGERGDAERADLAVHMTTGSATTVERLVVSLSETRSSRARRT